MAAPVRTVVLVPIGESIDPDCENSLHELERRGFTVRRARGFTAIDAARNQMASDALAEGFDELVWIGAQVIFRPDDVLQLRAHGLPFVCGLYPKKGFRAFACTFSPGARTVTFGQGGGLIDVRYCGFGLVYTRRVVYDTIRDRLRLPTLNRRLPKPMVPYFAPLAAQDDDEQRYLAEDYAFCERARQCGFGVKADTTIRLWHVGSYRYGWEDAGRDPERSPTFQFRLRDVAPVPSAVPALEPQRTCSGGGDSIKGTETDAARNDPLDAKGLEDEFEPAPRASTPPPFNSLSCQPLRDRARPLPAFFPRFKAYIVTYPANQESLDSTLADFRGSDWGEEPVVLVQPAEWARGKDSASNNYKRALEHAAADGCDFALILEDDVRVTRHLRHNLSTLPLVRRDQCDYLSLFMPDLVRNPWERREPHLGYRLAKPAYSGPNTAWEKLRIWGSQAYLLSGRFVSAALERWDRLKEGQDTRVLSVCSELKVPLWYPEPCFAEHAPFGTAFGTPSAYAPDFAPEFRLEIGPGFQPPEAITGWLTEEEGELLWRMAQGRSVLELGTASGRSTVCLGQQARRVVSVDRCDQAEAAEWVRRYELSDRIEFRRGEIVDVCRGLIERFDLVFVDTEHDAASVTRDIEAALLRLVPGGLLAFQEYPDPWWPDVRRVVDESARKLGWKRIAQAGYVGVFGT